MSQTKQLQILNSGLLTETEVIATQLEGLPQVIRRDEPGHDSGKQRVVSWLGHKIERAVGAACVAQGSDPVLAKEARSTIETRLLKERPLFIHVEQLQDIVEETLIDLGHPKIALAYGKYRARRAA
jgi:ribonucleoside-diphosphate reductase alpha chain